jgi:ribonucleoside-triphosphate reductase (thioredoxin)
MTKHIETKISAAIGQLSIGQKMMAESKFYMGYSRWSNDEGAFESWDQAVGRVMEMHRDKYADKLTPELRAYMEKAQQAYSSQEVLGAQRALQFGGFQLRKHEAKMYNCSVSHADRAEFFSEAMYLLLCGCGVGFSVQQRHVSKLPKLRARSEKNVQVFTVPDSIEGWADAYGVLLSSFFEDGGAFPEYKGARVLFDYSKIRAKNTEISGGFKAPGPDGLRLSLERCQALLEKLVQTVAEGESVAFRAIAVYDFVMHMSDAVLSGGVRRSATICLFDRFDTEMLNAKTGDWFIENPQRGRSNNSVVLKRDEVTREEWKTIMASVRAFGEPGFVFVEDYDFCYNPCVEIGMLPRCVQTGESGFQFCNLTEINGGKCVDRETFLRACEAGAILGTLQAGYTNFKYLGAATKRITENEALIGVSITGWMNNPDVLFDEKLLKEGAELVKRVNRAVAKLIGIKPAARTTCAKPSGNASVLLKTASGIHGEHSPMYMRNVQMNIEDEVAQLIARVNPKMVQKSVWSANGTDVVVSFPVIAKEGSIYKADLMGVKQLEFVKKAQQHWVENGTNVELCVHPLLRHNISNTISVDDWDEVEQYIYDNRGWFAGISLMAASGDKAYPQAPFTEVRTPAEILELYGAASMFASGLIVDGNHAYDDNLWTACTAAMTYGVRLTPELTMAAIETVNGLTAEHVADPLQRDWIRRFHKFAVNHFGGDLQKTEFCLKDSYNLHKWVGILNALEDVDFTKALTTQKLIDADSMAGQACAGGVCDISLKF